MQQCMKSDISSTQGNRAAVPACTGTGTAPGATWVVDGDDVWAGAIRCL